VLPSRVAKHRLGVRDRRGVSYPSWHAAGSADHGGHLFSRPASGSTHCKRMLGSMRITARRMSSSEGDGLITSGGRSTAKSVRSGRSDKGVFDRLEARLTGPFVLRRWKRVSLAHVQPALPCGRLHVNAD